MKDKVKIFSILLILSCLISFNCFNSFDFLKTQNNEANDNIEGSGFSIRYFSVYYSSRNLKYEVYELYDKNAVAIAKYKNSYNVSGWAELSIQTNKNYSDTIQAFGAGYLEGYITSEKIYDHYLNLRKANWKNEDLPNNIKEFLTKQNDYIQSLVKVFENNVNKGVENDIYSTTALNIYYQFIGMFHGYNAKAAYDSHLESLDLIQFHVVGSSFDLDDLVNYKVPTKDLSKMESYEILRYFSKKSHCSAIIKLKADYSDLWVAHNTWTNYQISTRILKTYELNFNDSKADSAKKVSFSSYPGSLNSGDDFYVTSNDLVVIETTNPILDLKLFSKLNYETLFTWHRNIIANRLAKDGEEWVHYFVQNNSGTYNNQFMIVDLKKVDTNKKTVEDEALVIVEQIPGDYRIEDVTKYLKHGFWNSYNIPFNNEIREKSGYDKILADKGKDPKYGNKINSTLNYFNNSRANIFRLRGSKLETMDDIKNLMRYNDYKNDELSLNSPIFSIASRMELEDDEKLRACEGAFDVKVVSINEIKGVENKKIHAVSGPPSGGDSKIPIFKWSDYEICGGKAPKGMINTFNFQWIEYEGNPPL